MILVMRSRIFVFILALSPSAYAVDTSICPVRIRLGYEDLIPVSEQRLEKLRRNPTVYARAVAAREAVIQTPLDKLQDFSFELAQRKSGVCHYRSGQQALEIYSRDGIDFMRVWLPVGPHQVFTAHVLDRISLRGIRVVYRPTTPLLLKVESRSYAIGWAYSMELIN